ncbi:MAG: SpoIID/LytB domain-containing protein [Planctomycetota bacterium]|jgi:stage II sporulation protein D
MLLINPKHHNINIQGLLIKPSILTFVKSSSVYYILLLLLLSLPLILSGCKRRQTTQPTPQMDAVPELWIRVLLNENVKSCKLKSLSKLSIINPKDGEKLTDFNPSAIPMEVNICNGQINISGQSFEVDELTVRPASPHIFSINTERYRGKLKLILNPDCNSFNTINFVPVEPYLAGVISAEMPCYWEPQALQAQAIAARTYCLYIKKRFGNSRSWDLKKTQANQVYHGLKAESEQTWSAINKTKGKVLVCKQPNNTKDIFPTYYSSTCGGYTEDSRNVFGGNFLPPLVGRYCPYCKKVVQSNFFFWPIISLDKAYVRDKLLKRYPNLKRLDKIVDIQPLRQSNHEEFTRLTMLKFIGSNNKSDTIRAEDFRLAVDPTGSKLRSTIFRIKETKDKWIFSSGRGYGHGVGMCQCGAQAMAREGKSAKQIIFYYFPDSKLKSIY